MTHTSKSINREFRIKAYGIAPNGKKINTLVGVSGLIWLVGEEFADKFVSKAKENMSDSKRFKLRRGLSITFYNK